MIYGNKYSKKVNILGNISGILYIYDIVFLFVIRFVRIYYCCEKCSFLDIVLNVF